MNYRSDVDGLRGLAVLAVVLFHAELGCPGGYLGVDVFFVISGFLITSILLARPVSLAQFWRARVRRLFPALALLVVTVLAVGPTFLTPADLADLGGSVLAQGLLTANLYFWSTANYWDGPAQLKPLLHTWSLAVEEQFYLLYPLLLPWLRRRLLSVVVLSLGLAWLWRGTEAGFYLLPTRAWELALGGWLTQLPPRPSRGLALVGLTVVILSFWTTPVLPLAPCLGTALFLHCHRGTLLTWRPLVGLGLVSYSWYLWHWPLLAYARYAAAGPLGLGPRFALVLGSLALAWASWRWVERPFREGRVSLRPLPLVWAALLVAGALVRVAPPAVDELAWMDAREPDWEAHTSLAQVQRGELLPLGRPGPPDFVLWGDSHAMTVRATVDRVAREAGRRGAYAAWEATPPVLGYVNSYRRSLGADSLPWNDAIFRYVRTHRVRDVLLVARWFIHAGDPEFDRLFAATVTRLREAGCTVWVLKQPPEYDQSVLRSLKRVVRLGLDPRDVGLTRATYDRDSAAMDRLLARTGVRVLDPTPYFFLEGRARVAVGSISLYCDADHLSENGAAMLAPLFQQAMR